MNEIYEAVGFLYCTWFERSLDSCVFGSVLFLAREKGGWLGRCYVGGGVMTYYVVFYAYTYLMMQYLLAKKHGREREGIDYSCGPRLQLQ